MPGSILYRPSNPENQFARCFELTLGVKLSTLSLSTSPALSGVCIFDSGSVFPRGRVGGVFGLDLSFPRKLSEVFGRRNGVCSLDGALDGLCIKVDDESSLVNGVESVVSMLEDDTSASAVELLSSTTRIVALTGLRGGEADIVNSGRLGLDVCVKKWWGGKPVLAQGRTVYR